MDFIDRRHLSTEAIITCFTALVAVLILKLGFSKATSGDLQWVLAPTAYLVELMSGAVFVHEPPAGFISRELGVNIAPVCSGINFMILSFCMIFFSFSHRLTRRGQKLLWLVLCMVVSYLATIAVNGMRIAACLPVIHNDIQYGWITPDRLHRAMGIVIYFAALFPLWALTDRLSAEMTRKVRANAAPGKKAVFLIPIFWYLLITIIVPLLNGGVRANTGRFLEHGLTIIVLCGAISAAALAVRSLVRRRGVRPRDEEPRRSRDRNGKETKDV